MAKLPHQTDPAPLGFSHKCMGLRRGVFVVLALCAGCYTEVAFDPEVEVDAGAVAQAEDTAEPSLPAPEESEETLAVEKTPQPFAEEEPTASQTAGTIADTESDTQNQSVSLFDEWELDEQAVTEPAETKASTTADTGDVGLPWQKSQEDSAPPPDAARFFAGLGSNQNTPPAPTTRATEPDPQNTPAADAPDQPDEVISGLDDSAMGSFLADAYSNLPVAEQEEVDRQESKKPQEKPRPSSIQGIAAPKLAPRPNAESLWPSDGQIVGIPKASKADTPKEPKSPTITATESEDAASLPFADTPSVVGDRYGAQAPASDPQPFESTLPPEPENPIAALDPEPEPESKPTNPVDVASRTPTRPYAPLPFELPADEPTGPPVSNPVVSTPKQPQALPPVQVSKDNTRHLAWLLGGKLGLARLAVAEGSTDAEARAWIADSKRLAEQLGIEPSRFGLDAPPTPGGAPERVLALLESAAVASDAIAREHGQDHAALLEASLKANAMLVLYKDRPDLVGPIANAVRDASRRAGLDDRLWSSPLVDLELSDSDEDVYQAVTALFASVESNLR